MRTTAVALIFASALVSPAVAGDICNYYRSHAKDLFNLLCTGSSRHAAVAGAHSSFTDGFNLNAGNLPTEPSSYGIETIASKLRQGTEDVSPDFAIVKGYQRIGTGVSTSSNDTFYGNDIVRRLRSTPELTTFAPLEPQTGHISDLNAGTSLALVPQGRGAGLNLGVSLRYNKTTNTFGGGPGILIPSEHFTVGVGVTRERVSNQLAPIYFSIGTLSASLLFLELEYSILTASGDLGLAPIHIVTASASISRLMLTAALRKLDYVKMGTVNQKHFAVQYLFSKSLSLGALYNYIPGATSLALQYYL